MLDTVRSEGLPGWLAVADAGYGVSEEFRGDPDPNLHFLILDPTG